MLDLKLAALACAAAFAIGATSAGVAAWRYKENQWQAAMSIQKAEASAMLVKATSDVLSLERERTKRDNKLEQQHAQAKTSLQRALESNRRLSAELGGLRDPGSRAGCSSSVPSASGVAPDADDSTTEGRLSREASEFLLNFAADADASAQYANFCHGWVKSLNE